MFPLLNYFKPEIRSAGQNTKTKVISGRLYLTELLSFEKYILLMLQIYHGRLAVAKAQDYWPIRYARFLSDRL